MKLYKSLSFAILAVVLSPLPVQANSPQDLRDQLQQAICLNNWDRASRLIQPLIGFPDITDAYRRDLIQLRRQIQDYRSTRAQIDMSHIAECQDLLANNPVEAESSPTSQGIDWNRAAASIQQTSRRQGSRPNASSRLSSDRQDRQQSVARVSNGEGGTYQYQLWRNWNGSEHYLFVWRRGASNSQSPSYSYVFASSREALGFFDCQFAERNLLNCNALTNRARRYTVPNNCEFPWQQSANNARCTS
ncbi:MAG: hypothetical protein ACFE0I_04820 [Elainellaceae cyanobacterium]